MAHYLYHRNSGRIYEVVGRDKTAGTITLRNDMATFSDNYDPAKFKAQGYFPVQGDDEDEARTNAEAKVAAEAGEDEEAA